MTHTIAHVGLGSNAPDAQRRIDEALDRIRALPGVTLLRISPIYRTSPQEMRDQPWFENGVAAVEVTPDWSAPRLLEALLGIETAMGRVRTGPRYGPRVIDLDLLLFGDATSEIPSCRIPHPRMVHRAFVLVPLNDIAPDCAIHGLPPRHWLAQMTYRLEGRDIVQ
ncbi:MAG: 2-amino-4-hydroxy-6-hydroxymethyldihydropteridine diphosphokinase [Desulfovibrio sp.]|nr:2-amino-4-hydroxy-6-hydroxymethyldihydropteridine diphosphokinase [Desulfovibrio sp.]